MGRFGSPVGKSGRAIVATRISQIDSLLRDEETALLVEAGSVDQLVRSIVRLLQDAPLRARLGAAARNVALQYTWERHVQRIDVIYRRIVGVASPA